MSDDRVAAIFIVGRHSFASTIAHHGARVLDVLNDASSAFLQVHDVAVFRGLKGKPVAECHETTIPKSAIDCVLLIEARHEAPLRRQYARVDKHMHHLFVLMRDYEIRGTAMFERAAEPVLMLGSGASNFFPLVTASVSSADSSGRPTSAAAAFVNKAKISLIHVEQKEVEHLDASSPAVIN